MSGRCGYTLVDAEGEQYPCDKPATGWRWYQNVGDHEDCLDVACEDHQNEGGNRLHAAEAGLAEAWDEGYQSAFVELDGYEPDNLTSNPYRSAS